MERICKRHYESDFQKILKIQVTQEYNSVRLAIWFSLLQVKLSQEFKEKTGPQMLGTLQKNVKNGHIIGSEVCYRFIYKEIHKFTGVQGKNVLNKNILAVKRCKENQKQGYV